jgi:hypothetical protein
MAAIGFSILGESASSQVAAGTGQIISIHVLPTRLRVLHVQILSMLQNGESQCHADH